MRETTKRIMLVGVGIILALLLIEMLVPMIPGVKTKFMMPARVLELRGDYGAVIKPDVDEVFRNAEGTEFRVRSWELEGSGFYVRDDTGLEEASVVAVGDSITFGAGVNMEESWPEHLEEMSGEEVLNMGVLGQNTLGEWRMFRDYGLEAGPEVVVWQVSHNDLPELRRHGNRSLPPLYRFRKYLAGHSYLYNTGKRMLHQATADPEQRPIVIEENGERRVVSSAHNIRSKSSMCESETMERMKDIILKAENRTEEEGAEFVLLIFTSKTSLYAEEIAARTGLSEDTVTCVRDLMREFAEDNNISYVDTWERYQTMKERGERVYLSNDGHLSPGGNRATAEEVLDLMRRNRYLN